MTEVTEVENVRSLAGEPGVPMLAVIPLPRQRPTASGMQAVGPVLKVILIRDHMLSDLVLRPDRPHGVPGPRDHSRQLASPSKDHAAVVEFQDFFKRGKAAELPGIRETVLGQVAGRAGDRVVGGKPLVVD